ncbi:OmpH family outer membrane protein [Adhaeribacter sp. BT258]|uniref:OmpH family outer membrane protein n=1 Tax=Adhaeribacter terrigena TaxID=2793070 RepID=A0ABS1BZ86_9BACT|nr:OmpH family outer membrane protein [Adhaeribacter terrigena]MBK0402420.1 OmpH family outer membrane protein [Adhaeribacter terrigena]
MKKLILFAAFPFALGLFSACDNKPKTVEKTPAKTEEPEKPTEIAADTAAAVTDTTVITSETTTATEATSGQKFGYINSADLIEIMPETKRAEASLKAYVKTLEKDLGGMQADYQRKVTEFQTQEKSMADVVKQTKIQAIQELEMQMQESQMAGQQKVADKRAELFKPILDKAEKAVKAVGKENGYDYIFDTNSGAFIYSKESHDVTPLVKKKLGLK